MPCEAVFLHGLSSGHSGRIRTELSRRGRRWLLLRKPPYGYMKDPEPDLEAAGNVKARFQLCVQGAGVSKNAFERQGRHVRNSLSCAQANGLNT